MLLFMVTPVQAEYSEVDWPQVVQVHEQSIVWTRPGGTKRRLEKHLSLTEVGDFDMSATRVCAGETTQQVLITLDGAVVPSELDGGCTGRGSEGAPVPIVVFLHPY